MIIDWFTVGAQALNFVILVWLLKRFLYKPILHAIDAREKRIAEELADADMKKAEASKERDEFKLKNKEFEQQRAALVSKATDEANAERHRLLEEARKAADALSAKRQEELDREQLSLSGEITRRAGAEVFAIARKVLADLAAASLEERLVEVFARRVQELAGTEKEELAAALRTSSDPALVRSAFELPAPQRAALQKALNVAFSADVRLRFEIAPDVISGIELTANGRGVSWNIAAYLSTMESRVGEVLRAQAKAPADPEAPAAATVPAGEAAAPGEAP